jgi:hypothetical protein
MESARKINTNGLLYHFLQQELWQEDVWLFQSLASRLILRLGIWISPQTYSRLPWLAPYARRDPACRGNKSLGLPDVWGSPDAEGFVRDDNSLLKGLPRSMDVTSTLRAYAGRRLDRGFTAAHVWREIHHESLASRHPLTYSFVPNLVWLPSDVAKLTDREGSFAQQFVQALALKIYRSAPVPPALEQMVDSAWSLLPEPRSVPAHALPETAALNYFVPTPKFLERRQKTFNGVVSALRSGGSTRKVVATRYAPGLASVDAAARHTLAERLELLSGSLSGP